MANLFNGQSPQPDIRQQIRANPAAFVSQIRTDPAAFVRRFGYDIPAGMTNPLQIIQHLYGNPPVKR